MKKGIASVLAASLSFFVFAGGAIACQGEEVLYEDDFSFADPGWGSYTDVRIADGALTLLPGENLYSMLLNQNGFLEGNVDVCVDLVQTVPDPTVAFGGLVFGGVDNLNFFVLEVSTDGYVTVARLQKGRWLTPFPWTLTKGVVKPGTESNQLRVVTNGGVVTAFVNGQQVAQIRTKLPKDGMLVGLYAQAATGKPTFAFDNLKVTEGSGELVAATSAPAATALTSSTAVMDVMEDEVPARLGARSGSPAVPKQP